MPANTFPTSTLDLGTLAEPDTPALLDLRPMLGAMSGPSGDILRDAFEQIQQAFDNIQQTLRLRSPSLQYLQIDAADIAVLAVGGQYGPGEFTVYNGPPDYAPIGWIGSRAKDTTVNVTSIVAGLVTAAASHLLKVGDNVYIEATTDQNNTGFYVVAAAPSATTFTVTGGVAGGNSTGGTMTKQFQGLWVKMGAIGGTAFDNAPFRVDVDGSLVIDNATITLTSADGTILLDPLVPAIIIKDAGGNAWATLAILKESPKAITAATNASPSVVTIVGHGYVNGDTVLIASATGNTAINGYRIVKSVTANTFTLTTIAGAAVNGNGAYAGSGTAARYYGGGLFQSIAIGASFADYKLRAFADGSLKIKDADILLQSVAGGVTKTIHLDPALTLVEVSSFDGSGGSRISLVDGRIDIVALDSVGSVDSDSSSMSLEPGYWTNAAAGLTTLAASRVSDVAGYTDTTEFGPLLSLRQIRGSPLAPAATQTDDTLGGIVCSGYKGSGGITAGPYSAGMRAVATENHTATARGAKLVFESMANGTVLKNQMTLDEDGSLDIPGAYKVGGVPIAGTPEPDPGTVAVSPSVGTTNTGSTAGGTYTATEQSMINTLVSAVTFLNTDVANLKTQVDNLITDRNNLRAVLQAHGVMA